MRVATVTTKASGEDNGTQAFAALNAALADVPPSRVAGSILVTDGEVHDAPAKLGVGAPLQVLIVGRRGERDRKLTVADAARYAIVGQAARIVVRVDDLGGGKSGLAHVALRIDGGDAGALSVPLGRDTPISVPIGHEGESVVEIEAEPGPCRTDAAEQSRGGGDQRRARPAARAADLRRTQCRRAGMAQSAQGRSLGRSGAFHDSAPAGEAGRAHRSRNCR